GAQSRRERWGLPRSGGRHQPARVDVARRRLLPAGLDRAGVRAARADARGRGARVSLTERPLVDIRLDELDTRGGVAPGISGVTQHVRYGEFFTFLGPPKSGKSDVMRAIAGFLPVTRGRALVDGSDISALPPRLRGA